MRISELAVDAVFTPSGLACVVVRPHPPRLVELVAQRPADVVDLGAIDRPDVLAEIADLASARSPS